MKLISIILNLVLVSSSVFALNTPRKASLLEAQVMLVNQGMASGQITNETKDFFLQSIKDSQNGTESEEEGRVAAFTRIVNEGIASGQITGATKDFFLKAVEEFNKNR